MYPFLSCGSSRLGSKTRWRAEERLQLEMEYDMEDLNGRRCPLCKASHVLSQNSRHRFRLKIRSRNTVGVKCFRFCRESSRCVTCVLFYPLAVAAVHPCRARGESRALHQPLQEVPLLMMKHPPRFILHEWIQFLHTTPCGTKEHCSVG